MKKIISVIAAAMLVIGVVTACGSAETSKSVSTDGSTSMNKVIGSLGEAFEEGVHDGVVYYGIDCLEVALKQAGIEYFVNKEDYDAFVVTNIGDIATDRQNQFGYYVKEKKATEFEDRNGLTAQHDEMVGGETLEFRFEAIKTTENR